MLNDMSPLELIKLLAPLIILQLGLAIYCIISILKNGVRNLNKGLWIVIVLFSNILGSILYLTIGKKRWEDD